MSKRLERVINIGVAVAGSFGQRDIAELIANPAKHQLGIDRLTDENLVPDPRQTRPNDLRTSGRLLPAYQVIQFYFREDELDDYLNWCGQFDTPLAVRLITGDSGRGKTRLMVELAGKLRDDGPSRPGSTKAIWASGFVNLEALQRLADEQGGDPYEVPFAAMRDLCLIIDYAENRPDEVTRILRAAVAAIDDGRQMQIRIILIARQHTEIFHTILQDSNLTHRQSVEFQDNPLTPVTDPEGFFQHACEALNVPESSRVYPEGLRSETPDCGILSLAALLAVEETTVTGSQKQILDKVLVHEKRYWKATAQRLGVPAILLNQNAHEAVAANLTLYGLQGAIQNIEEGVKLIANIPLLADQDHSVRHALVKSIADLYPHPDGRIEGVGLDLLADHLVATMVDYII
jgi:hypothetical protein